ncbi:hypothetical protein SUGI_0135520 [Cryptomeria japonica]|uniref:glutathione S-transferase U7-like isoform X1 n=1 Tax=Cryptomeria japonica TaxID=3369 RepID=UPI002408CAB6|nr:glutathione S-transferase U7-like isoform X1 [Cryptomeria japonica]GLJ10810.1 hypothetical protein SUGI_0135520 [Cryptomeria japonica]
MEEELKVLGAWASPYSVRVQIALDLKGINYTLYEQDLINKSQLLLQSNPVHKKIPALIHNGKAISESLIILQYIDETWPVVPLLPKHPYERAVALFWAAFIDDKFSLSFRGIYRTQGEKQEKCIKETVANMLVLEEALKGRPFFGGESVGYVDIVLGCRAVWIQVCEEIGGVKLIDPHNTPFLYAWVQRFCNLDCVKKWLPDFDKLLSYAYMVRNYFLQQQAN